MLLAACAGKGPQPEQAPSTGILVEGIMIRNELAYPVTDVMVEVPATGAFAGCGNIMSGTACSTSFQQTDYRANALQIHWREHGQQKQTGEFVVDLPPGLGAGETCWIEVIVFAPGEAGARLIRR